MHLCVRGMILMAMADAPDYVRNFKKPPKTEIKEISGHYYLYACTYQYDRERKRSKKIPGRYLGAITPDGLVPPHSGPERAGNRAPARQADCVEMGAVCYFYPRTEEMRLRLRRHFPDLWEKIYVIALIRAVYGSRIAGLQTDYEYSILSHLFPDLSLSPDAVTEFLRFLGTRREAMISCMREDIRDSDRFLLLDGRSMPAAPGGTRDAEPGCGSVRGDRPRRNVCCVFSLDGDSVRPVYYKQYSGADAGGSACADMLAESGIGDREVTVVADEASAGEETLRTLEESHVRCIIPLRRGNGFVRGRVPSSLSGYEEMFPCGGREIHSLTIREEGFRVHLFLDTALLAEERAAVAARADGAGSAGGQPGTAAAGGADPDGEEIGTIALKTTAAGLSARQCYELYRQRQRIGSLFSAYGAAPDQDAPCLRDRPAQEGWLFLNHLSAVICAGALKDIAGAGESGRITYRDLTRTLVKIQSAEADGRWGEPVIKKSAGKLFDQLGFDAADYSVLPLYGGHA